MFLYKKDKREFCFYFIILNVPSSKILFFFSYFASHFFRARYLDTCVLSRITFKIRWMGNAVPSSERSDKRGDIIAPPTPKNWGKRGGIIVPPSPHWGWRERGIIMFYGDRTLKIAPYSDMNITQTRRNNCIDLHSHSCESQDRWGLSASESRRKGKKIYFLCRLFRAQGVSASGGVFTSTTI
jgi:hypothetical protein